MHIGPLPVLSLTVPVGVVVAFIVSTLLLIVVPIIIRQLWASLSLLTLRHLHRLPLLLVDPFPNLMM